MIKFIQCLLSAICYLLFAIFLYADNFSDLKILTQENSISLRIAKKQIDLARMRKRATLREFFPQIKLQWRETKGETLADPYKSINYGGKMIFPIFKGWSTKYKYISEKMGFRTAVINYDKVQDKLNSDLSETYWNVVKSKMNSKIWNKLVKGTEDYYELSKLEHDVGGTTELEFERADLIFNTAKQQLEMIKENLTLAWMILRNVLHIPPFEEISVDDEFQVPIKPLPYTLNQCKEMGIKNSHKVQAAEVTKVLAQYREKSLHAEGWPQIFLEANYGRSGEAYTTEEFDLIEVWSVMGKLKLPLFGNTLLYSHDKERADPTEIVDVSLRTESITNELEFSFLDNLNYSIRKKESEVSNQQAKENYKIVKDEVEIEIVKAFHVYKQGLSGVKINKVEMRLKRKEAEVVEQLKKVDEKSTSDVITSKMERAKAEISHVESLYKYYVARDKLEIMVKKQ